MTPKAFNFQALIVLTLLISSCAKKNFQPTSYYEDNFATGTTQGKSGLGFSIPDKYNIDVFQGDDMPPVSFSEMQKIELTDEKPITKDQVGTDKLDPRMLKRGNDSDQKRELMQKLVAQAEEMGASALIKVRYKVFTTVKGSGYTLEGIAVRYQAK
jgi:hypothetical protein